MQPYFPALTAFTTVVGLTAATSAATITGSVLKGPVGDSGSVDQLLTSSPTPVASDPGFGDWKVWDATTNLDGSDEKIDGTFIGSLSEIDNGANNFSTGSALGSGAGAAALDWAWSDGTPQLTDGFTGGTNNGGLQSNTGGDSGDGYRLTITLPNAAGRILYAVGVRESIAQLTVTSSVSGTSGFSPILANTGGNNAAVYALDYTGGTSGEVLTLDWTLINTADSDRRLRIFGAAIDQPIPEPASLALLGLGGLLLLPRRKRNA